MPPTVTGLPRARARGAERVRLDEKEALLSFCTRADWERAVRDHDARRLAGHLEPGHWAEANRAMVAKAIAPDFGLGAHVAPLGLAFSNARMPATYASGAFIGQHGSWNRKSLAGYNVIISLALAAIAAWAAKMEWRTGARSAR